SRRRHTRSLRDWSSDVCSSDLNQFYLIAKSAGLDYRRVLDAMKRNYPRARSIPTPGLAAGPCLFKDTMQLAAFAQNQFSLGNAEIGRASCRERVWVWVVAGSFI